MSVYPCAGCGQRVPGRLASLYTAWFLADGSRTAWKQRLCASCVGSQLKPLLAAALEPSPDVTACPACGKDASNDLDPIYLTLYLPKQESREFALTTCASCAVKLRLRLQDRAERLPDRSGHERTCLGTYDSWSDLL
jgi:hypothetical protein